MSEARTEISKAASPRKQGKGEHAAKLLREELGAIQLRLGFIQLFVKLLPVLAFGRVRTVLYRAAGVKIGARSLVFGTLRLMGPGAIAERFTVGEDCVLNAPFFADLSGPITLGKGVTIGHHSRLITAEHAVHRAGRRAGVVTPRPIVIEEGAWLSAGVTVLPGVTIGHGSVVAAGAVVTADVAPNTLVGGVPARFIKSLPETPF
jgi:maltose O-acetyltransferase